MVVPPLTVIDLKECGCAFGTVCAELLLSRRCTSCLIDNHLIALVERMINGHDTRQDIQSHLNGRFPRLIEAAECAATNNEYLRRHLDAIRRPFNIS
ncbi:MAG: hypothetical protein WCT27_04895 [Patescibacteria group bacterium]